MEKDRTAPELYGSFWFNSDPIALHALQGSVVALFFWDHTSMTSLRAIKHMNMLQAKYHDCGFTMIGVHHSEYAVIRDPAQKETIMRSCGIQFPVVADDERFIAESYRIESLPSICLISSKGDIYDVVTSQGSLSRLERSIQYLLRQAGYFGELPFVELFEDRAEQYPSFAMTPDLDLGYIHGVLGNSEGYNPEMPAEYHDPFLYVEGKFYAQGIWIAGKNSFRFVGEGNDGYILFPYTGHDVDIVAGNDTETDSVRVSIDEKPVDREIRGRDIVVEADGSTLVKINALTSTHLISNKAIQTHTVKLTPSKKGTTFYRVSLAPYEEPVDKAIESQDENDHTPYHKN
jgi:hypothetical protein